ncbi:MAG TPA: DUF368 domain-containing protein [Aquaticitalea sp.]|nr:DUF368 domain-containing protein [Aquaticitalea sp.]HNU58586.1 DUF368 domain-containing protein [Aquaticitalea sp.]
MKRSVLNYTALWLKGMAMGAADVVPGVSGGTIAFISGIYEELIETIHKIDLGFFKIWKEKGIVKAWHHYNLSFLAVLLSGIFISILTFANLISWLLHDYPILIWAFFFGLVVASIVFVGQQITRWSVPAIVALALASAFSYWITVTEPIGSPDSAWFLFFAGFIAIIAMILPGISGAFILLLLGAYKTVIGIITQLIEGVTTLNSDAILDALGKVIIFGLGAVVGIKVFSGTLNWMFKHHKNITLALLTGFMVGALNKIWPWKEVIRYTTNSDGKQVPFVEKSILPSNFDGDTQLLSAIFAAIIGFLVIFVLERLGSRKAQ